MGVGTKRGPCQPTLRTQGSERPLAIRGLRLNWQATSVRRLSVPVPCRFSCKAGSPETKLQFGQLLRGPRIRAKGAAPLAVSKWTDSLCVLARGLSPPFLPSSALLWVTAGPVFAGCRGFSDSRQPLRPGWGYVSFGTPGPAAQWLPAWV